MTKNLSENANFLLEDEEESIDIPESIKLEANPLVLNIMELHFSVGEISWTMSSGKKIILFRSGDWIQKKYLKKFIDAKKSLDLETSINEDYCSIGLELFDSFVKAEGEAEKVELREAIIDWLSVGYWNSEKDVGLVDLSFVCSQTFYSFTEEEEELLDKTSTELFKRSSVTASMLVCFALVLGYLDRDFLKDLYHISFLFDCSIDESKLSTNLISALEGERQNNNSWKKELNDKEKELFLNHSQMSVKKSLDLFKERIKNPGLFSLIETHHEKVNGEGFPLGLRSGEISDIEGLIIFVNNRLPYHNLKFEKGDAGSLFRNLMDSGTQLDSVLTKRLRKVITNEFENRDSEHAKYLEITGV